jgi:hypothetical protein
MCRIKDFQIVAVRLEELPRLRERKAMLFLVASIFGVVSFNFHNINIGQ